jgi:integrase/recombinase XerD
MITKPPTSAELTIVDLETSMADVAGQLMSSSRRVYLTDARQFASWLLEHGLTPQTCTRSDIITYRSYLQETYEKATASRKLVVARRLLAEQVNSGRITSNPAEGVKGFKVDNETTHLVLSEDEAQKLLDAIPVHTLLGQRDSVLILFLMRTGAQRSEAAALRLCDLTVEQGHHIAIIRHGKGDKRRKAKVPVDVWREIAAYIEALRGYHTKAITRKLEELEHKTNLEDEARKQQRQKIMEQHNMATDDPLFVSFRRGDHATRKPMGDKAIETQVKHYAEIVGLDRLTPHGLRAMFITLALENNAKLQQVQYAAGHSDPRTTERYQERKFNLDDNAVDYVRVKRKQQAPGA